MADRRRGTAPPLASTRPRTLRPPRVSDRTQRRGRGRVGGPRRGRPGPTRRARLRPPGRPVQRRHPRRRAGVAAAPRLRPVCLARPSPAAEGDRLATPPRRDDAVEEHVRPVERVEVPGDVVGVHDSAAEESRQALGEGRPAAARPTVHEDEGLLPRREQRTQADGQLDVVERLPCSCLRFLGVQPHPGSMPWCRVSRGRREPRESSSDPIRSIPSGRPNSSYRRRPDHAAPDQRSPPRHLGTTSPAGLGLEDQPFERETEHCLSVARDGR